MSERDELATLIGDYPWPSSWDRETHRAIADAILAAGIWLPHIPESQIVYLELDDE